MTKINKDLVTNSGTMHDFMERLCQKPEGNVFAPLFGECLPTPQQYKNSVRDLQKYITDKIADIPKVREEGVAESEPVMRLIKLRRALQSYSYTWRNPDEEKNKNPMKFNPPPTPTFPSQYLDVVVAFSSSPPQTSVLTSSGGSYDESVGSSMLSVAS